MASSRTTPTRAKKAESKFSILAAEKETRDELPEEPFTVDLPDGEVVTLVAPSTLEWKVMSTLSRDEPFRFLQTVLAEGDFEKLAEHEITTGAMRKLMAAWSDYYQVDVGN